jgi:hypothetical protein
MGMKKITPRRPLSELTQHVCIGPVPRVTLASASYTLMQFATRGLAFLTAGTAIVFLAIRIFS